MNASDVLREYKDYLKIIERKNGNPADIEKAKIIIEALEQQISSKSLDFEEERLQEVVYYPNFAETKETVANMKNWIDLGYRVHTCFVRQAEVVVVYEKVR